MAPPLIRFDLLLRRLELARWPSLRRREIRQGYEQISEAGGVDNVV